MIGDAAEHVGEPSLWIDVVRASRRALMALLSMRYSLTALKVVLILSRPQSG